MRYIYGEVDDVASLQRKLALGGVGPAGISVGPAWIFCYLLLEF